MPSQALILSPQKPPFPRRHLSRAHYTPHHHPSTYKPWIFRTISFHRTPNSAPPIPLQHHNDASHLRPPASLRHHLQPTPLLNPRRKHNVHERCQPGAGQHRQSYKRVHSGCGYAGAGGWESRWYVSRLASHYRFTLWMLDNGLCFARGADAIS